MRSRLLVDASIVDIAGTLGLGTTSPADAERFPSHVFSVTNWRNTSLECRLMPWSSPPHAAVICAAATSDAATSTRQPRRLGLGGLVPHELRHTAAGVPIHRVRGKHQGRADDDGARLATMTWDRYGHLYDDDLDTVAERLDIARAEFLRTTCGQSADSGGNVVGMK